MSRTNHCDGEALQDGRVIVQNNTSLLSLSFFIFFYFFIFSIQDIGNMFPLSREHLSLSLSLSLFVPPNVQDSGQASSIVVCVNTLHATYVQGNSLFVLAWPCQKLFLARHACAILVQDE